MTLSAQLTASQAQVSALQAEVERATLAVSAMKAELELGKEKARKAELGAEERVLEAEAECDRKVAAVEEELRAAETIRRKLHNQVQELKGGSKRSWSYRAYASQATFACLRVSALHFPASSAIRRDWPTLRTEMSALPRRLASRT